MHTPLHCACISDSFAAIHYLLAFNADINSQDKKGNTPLHLAVRASLISKNDYLVVKLVMKGAKRDIPDYSGRIPFDLILNNSSDDILSEAIKSSLLSHLVKFLAQSF